MLRIYRQDMQPAIMQLATTLYTTMQQSNTTICSLTVTKTLSSLPAYSCATLHHVIYNMTLLKLRLCNTAALQVAYMSSCMMQHAAPWPKSSDYIAMNFSYSTDMPPRDGVPALAVGFLHLGNKMRRLHHELRCINLCALCTFVLNTGTTHA